MARVLTAIRLSLRQAACCAGLLLLGGGSAAAGETVVTAGVSFEIENYAIATALTATPGDPARGLAVIEDRKKGNCIGCHQIPHDTPFQGTTGPSLSGVGERLSPAQLRLRLVDSKRINPFSMMPAYFRTAGLYRVAPKFADKTILSAQEIEDVVAYLASLKSN